MTPVLDIIVVNWNVGEYLRACLRSVLAADRSELRLGRVAVVDNGSTHDPADGIEALALPIQMIRNADNRGFAAACNQGAAGSRADYLLFLNPDIRLLPDSLVEPIALLQKAENVRVGIVGIQLLDEGGTVQRSCSQFPTVGRYLGMMLGLDRLAPRLFPSQFMVEWDHGDTRPVDQVMGAFFLVRRSLFERLGGFDERFFVYYEEVDFSFRACREGWRSIYLATARAYHTGGASSEQVKAKRLFYNLRSRLLFGYKYFGFLQATFLLLATLTVEPLTRVVWAIARRVPREVKYTLLAYAMLLCALPEIVRHGRSKV